MYALSVKSALILIVASTFKSAVTLTGGATLYGIVGGQNFS